MLDGQSEDELGFQEGTLWCDAAAFEQACAAGRLAEALQLYRGGDSLGTPGIRAKPRS